MPSCKLLAVAHSATLWNHIENGLENFDLQDIEKKRFNSFRNLAAKSIKSDSEQALLIFENINTDDLNHLDWFSIYDYYFDSYHWKMIRIYQDDAMSLGYFNQNDFGICYKASFDFSLNEKYNNLNSINKVNLSAAAPAINNHTCVRCGNTKCSKSETVCWKCGCNPH